MAALPSRGVLVVALAVVGLALAGAAGLAALAGAAAPQRQQLIDSTVRFLQEHQRPSGGFANPGQQPSQGVSAWVTLALAAAGINPQDQASCGIDGYAFLETHFAASFREEAAWPETATTAFERELLVVDAAGTDPHDFAGYDLVAEILDRQLPDGSFPYVPGGRGEINDTAFAVLALSPVEEPAAEAAVREATEWLLAEQNDDGSWSWQVKGQTDNVDLTGGVLEALSAAGRRGTEAEAVALAFLHRVQGPDGGWSESGGGGESNVASTAWVVQGLWAVGQDPEAWRTGSGETSEEPLDYMESLQQPDGHVRWRASSDMNGIWMTAYVTPALAGRALPFAFVPRAQPPRPEADSASLPASCAEPGPGGGDKGGATAPTPPPPSQPASTDAVQNGVIAGGGGEGAPDFSRPEPRSKGKTPGGARLVHEGKGHARDHSATRRGKNAAQPRGTETAEPSEAAASAPPPPVVGMAGGSTTGAGASGGQGAATARRAPAVDAAAAGERSASRGEQVSGALIGSPTARRRGKLAFGAPGLRSGGGGGGAETTVALAIGALALLGALGGASWERRCWEAP